METTVLNPKYVYVQATTPSDLTEGKLWYNTTTKELYSSDGSSYSVMQTDTSSLELQQLKQSIAILHLEANASLTSQDYETMFLDVFSENTGYDNTIDTGNTNAFFNTSIYFSGNTAYGAVGGYCSGGSGDVGVKFTPVEDCTLTSVKIKTGSQATKCYLKDAGKSTIATVDITDHIATFNNALTGGTSYWLFTDAEGAQFNKVQLPNAPYPIISNNITFTEGDSFATTFYEIEEVNYTGTDGDVIIQTNAIPVTTGQKSHQLYCNNTTTGTGAITYDISFDNGATWDTNQAINTKNTRTSTTGTQMIIKLNLSSSGAGNTATVSDYAVMLWY